MFFPKARTLRRRAPLASRAALLLLACLPAAAPAPAQVGGTESSGTGGNHTIQGRLVGPSGRRSDLRLKVKLESSGHGDLYVFSDPNGSFRFTLLRPGSYTVVVEGGEDFETVRESVSIDPTTIRTRNGIIGTPFSRPITLQIYLRPKRESSDLAQPGVLNAALANVPKQAAELYQRGMEHARRNEHERAADLLKMAVEAHPNFPLALNELGVTYLKLKRPEKAAEALGAALKLAPEEHHTLVAYGRALLDLQRLSESEEQFRKALSKNASSPWARFYLGLILVKRRDLDGAEAEFKSALGAGGPQLALAHYYLGGIYWNKGQYKQAAEELETYLRLAPDAPDAARLRETIKEFRKKK
ncbi:MAG TPA: tetratricopeptide repeat protein [Pyrinomonadaceae bacterium]|nr:tetratricopeptide repeat protein [Pyrinomonadaceae bacterium]